MGVGVVEVFAFPGAIVEYACLSCYLSPLGGVPVLAINLTDQEEVYGSSPLKFDAELLDEMALRVHTTRATPAFTATDAAAR